MSNICIHCMQKEHDHLKQRIEYCFVETSICRTQSGNRIKSFEPATNIVQYMFDQIKRLNQKV